MATDEERLAAVRHRIEVLNSHWSRATQEGYDPGDIPRQLIKLRTLEQRLLQTPAARLRDRAIVIGAAVAGVVALLWLSGRT